MTDEERQKIKDYQKQFIENMKKLKINAIEIDIIK